MPLLLGQHESWALQAGICGLGSLWCPQARPMSSKFLQSHLGIAILRQRATRMGPQGNLLQVRHWGAKAVDPSPSDQPCCPWTPKTQINILFPMLKRVD